MSLFGCAEVDIRLGLRAEQSAESGGRRDGRAEGLPDERRIRGPTPLAFKIPRSPAVVPPLTS